MAEMYKDFSWELFYKDLNLFRSRQRITWNRVASRINVSSSLLHNFVRSIEDPNFPKKNLSIDTVVKLMQWMGQTDLEPYLVDEYQRV
jgi:hypothetical protein